MIAQPLSVARVIFVLATPESGGERLARALGCLPGTTAMPVATNVFSQGVGSLVDVWTGRMRESLGEHADDGRFLGDVRRLADAPFAAWASRTGSAHVVEYSDDHIGYASLIATVYPDAGFVHLVRDGRQVAESLASPLRGWPPGVAARRWYDDQQAVAGLGDTVDVHTVRIEDVLADPEYYIKGLAERLGIDVDDDAVGQATAILGTATAPPVRTGRVATMVEVLGSELLSALGYEVEPVPPARRAAAKLELSQAGDVGWAVGSALKRARAAIQEQ